MSKKCPRCGGSKLHRSSSEPQEGEFHILQLPVRCEECGERFWILSRRAWALILWIIVIMIAAVTIALLIPTKAPEGGALACNDRHVGRARVA
jgi:uncharacterized protein (DUF983 family)